MPNDAVARLKTRLANHRAVTTTADRGGEYGVLTAAAASEARVVANVALEKPGPTVYALVFIAISRSRTVVPESGGWIL